MPWRKIALPLLLLLIALAPAIAVAKVRAPSRQGADANERGGTFAGAAPF